MRVKYNHMSAMRVTYVTYARIAASHVTTQAKLGKPLTAGNKQEANKKPATNKKPANMIQRSQQEASNKQEAIKKPSSSLHKNICKSTW